MTIGIDYGTSTSEIAYYSNTNANDSPVLIPNHLGEFITPSVVYIREDGTPVIGREALALAQSDPGSAFMESKRLLGQKKTLTARGVAYTPADIASIIIRYLKDCAGAYLKQEADSAVITVPAYFNETQRREVIAAGERAGLKVERIINEPTAASLDYGINHLGECGYVLVYDFGGGTLDVTVLELFEGVVDVKSSCGNNRLGGKDFDQKLIEYITGSILTDEGADITGDPQAMIRVKSLAEQTKIALSNAEEHNAKLTFANHKTGAVITVDRVITRQSFEDMIGGMVRSTARQVKTALFDAGLAPEDIGLTLLVGGSARIPMIARFLRDTFNFEPKTLIDPITAVVRGAAIQAGIISGVLNPGAIVLTDICPYSLSTEAFRSPLDSEPVCDILIRRNTTLPAKAAKSYYTAEDSQDTVIISAYQGEGVYPEENYLLNKFRLTGIPKAKAGKEQILVTFSYDLNGLLTISAEIVSTGKSASVTVNTSEERRDLSGWNRTERAESYRRCLYRAERLIRQNEIEDKKKLSAAVDGLKQGLVLGWDDFILEELANDLQQEINKYEL